MPKAPSRNSLNTLQALVIGQQVYNFYSLKSAAETLGDLTHLPCCMRILLENLLRYEDEEHVTQDDMRTLTAYHALHKNIPTLSFHPSRLLAGDDAGLSLLTDVAALYDAMADQGIKEPTIDTACPLDISARYDSFTEAENADRCRLLKWGEQNLPSTRIIPPENGSIGHINLYGLSPVVTTVYENDNEVPVLIPDTVMGSSASVSMVNALGILGWRTDPLEIQSLLFNHTSQLQLPGVIGVKLTGKVHKSATPTDIALAIATAVAKNNPAGKIIEFFGAALDHLTVPDRALIARMLNETDVMACYFPVDTATIQHLATCGHDEHHLALVETYAKEQGLWRESGNQGTHNALIFSSEIEMALDSIRPSLGNIGNLNAPVALGEIGNNFEKNFPVQIDVFDPLAAIKRGDIAVASLDCCGAVAHPVEMVMAGILAKKASSHGLKVKPWVRTGLNLESPVVETLLLKSGLLDALRSIKFIPDNADFAALSRPTSLQENIEATIKKSRLSVCSLCALPHPQDAPLMELCKAQYITSPAMVVAYAIAGSILSDIANKPVGTDDAGKSVLLKEIWPTAAEIHAIFEHTPLAGICSSYKEEMFVGDIPWQAISCPEGKLFSWPPSSCMIKKPPFLAGLDAKQTKLQNIRNAKVFSIYTDQVPASHIAPSGPIQKDGPAGHYLMAYNLQPDAFYAFKDRTGNYEVMGRGAYCHKNLHNSLLATGSSLSGQTTYGPEKLQLSVFDAAERYHRDGTPLILVGGKNFGYGSGQEWAAKSTKLFGIKAVLAESFAPLFRVNLLRVGVLPLVLKSGVSVADLKLDGEETIHFAGMPEIDHLPGEVMMTIERHDGVERYMVVCDIKTNEELEIFRSGSVWAALLKSSL